MAEFTFEKATRRGVKLRVALIGPSGSGKTMSAMRLAKGIGGSVALIDTENRRARYYSDVLDFDTLDLGPPFSPERYVAAMAASAEAGHEVLIVDSSSHEWMGPGGILWDLDHMDGSNNFAKWRLLTPRHMAFIDAMIRHPAHLIVTMRGKDMYVLDEKNRPEKIGMGPQQREGLEYEFTVAFNIAQSTHIASASKDNTRLFQNVYEQLGERSGKALLEWANSGEGFDPMERSNQAVDGAVGATAGASRNGAAKPRAWWVGDNDAEAKVAEIGTIAGTRDEAEQRELKAWLKALAISEDGRDEKLAQLDAQIDELLGYGDEDRRGDEAEPRVPVENDAPPAPAADPTPPPDNLELAGQTDEEAAAETAPVETSDELDDEIPFKHRVQRVDWWSHGRRPKTLFQVRRRETPL